MKQALESALDDLASPRSSLEVQGYALTRLEETLAKLLLSRDWHATGNNVSCFLRLQDSFECNLASRLLPWLTNQAQRLRKLFDSMSNELSSKGDEQHTIASHIVQSLILLQGAALLHGPTKEFLGRKYAMEVLLDLLSICRHASSMSLAGDSSSTLADLQKTDKQTSPPLASSILDTLLCTLVDSPSAIRMLEELDGLGLIVKILKRPTVSRDVRMKCLEFLYFYLMDENSPASGPARPVPIQLSSLSRSTTHEMLHDRATVMSSTNSPAPSLRSSTGASSAFSSFGSWSPTSTLSGTPPQSPTKSNEKQLGRDRSSLAMLRRDVDFVPLSPKKAQISKLGVDFRNAPGMVNDLKGRPRTGLQRKPSPLSRNLSEDTLFLSDEMNTDNSDDHVGDVKSIYHTRTTEEKKGILGQLLGNVDALVDGVKKAGIWGLGE